MRSESEIKERLEYWQRRLEEWEKKTGSSFDDVSCIYKIELDEGSSRVAAILREGEEIWRWIEALEWVLSNRK